MLVVILVVVGIFIVAIVIMLKAPKGIWGLIKDRFNLELFPLGYRVEIPHDSKGA